MAMQGGSYSTEPSSVEVGPEGGDVLVERTVELLKSLWSNTAKTPDRINLARRNDPGQGRSPDDLPGTLSGVRQISGSPPGVPSARGGLDPRPRAGVYYSVNAVPFRTAGAVSCLSERH